MQHVVWDWNGTLFDDLEVVVAAVNAVMADVGRPAITAADYQRLYTRPVHLFYERLFDRPVADDEWPRLDDVFHVAYAEQLHVAGLADDAHRALDRVEDAGLTQSVLSMYRDHELVPLVEDLGIADRFLRVDGLRAEGGGMKDRYLAGHLERVGWQRELDVSQVLVVGDAIDDARAAEHVGAQCVLYDGGSHPREELIQAGAPVADTLEHALDLAGIP